jgi:formate/nitrite transporter FocA (FNT family)
MLSGLLLEDAVLYNAHKKVVNPPDKQLFMGFLAGIWVGLGGLTSISIAGGIPEQVRLQWISLPKLLLGAFFAFGNSSWILSLGHLLS